MVGGAAIAAAVAGRPQLMELAGRVALVTGGARRLGKQDALTLASEGCRVIVLDLTRPEFQLPVVRVQRALG